MLFELMLFECIFFWRRTPSET